MCNTEGAGPISCEMAEKKLTEKDLENIEREKELACLYQVAELANDPELSLYNILENCVPIIAAAYQYPEITCVRIRYHSHMYESQGCRESPWVQQADIVNRDVKEGSIDVYYTEEKPREDEGPFLKEERYLLNSLVAIIGSCVKRRQAEVEVLKAQEKERMQVGMELHDNVKQILAAAKIHLEIIKTNAGKKALVRKVVSSVQDYVSEAIDELRRLSHTLAPAVGTKTSLKEQIRQLVIDLKLEDQMRVNLDVTEFTRQLNPNVQLAVYRILQEQLSNVVKYAMASTLHIKLRIAGEKVELRVEDDGVGFDPQKQGKGIGLENIKRRTQLLNGKLTVHSIPGKGCRTWVEIPLVPPILN